jgi:hypothetical protein
MALRVEFDHGGRTYTVDSPSFRIWNVHILAEMNNTMTIETDLRTGQRIFVTWSEVGVVRLLSDVDEKGMGKPMPPWTPPAPQQPAQPAQQIGSPTPGIRYTKP